MKNRLLTLLMLVAVHALYAQTSYLAFEKNTFALAKDAVTYGKEWPKDSNGDEDAALIRVKIVNVTAQELDDVEFKLPTQISISERVTRADLSEVWLFVNAAKISNIGASIGGYGSSVLYTIDQDLKPKNSYKIILVNNKMVTISIETTPSNATVVIDDVEQIQLTPLHIESVTVGNHRVSLSINGKLIKDTVITVSDNKIHFPFDLRKTRLIRIESEPAGAQVYLNGSNVSRGKTPLTLSLPYDSYQIIAKIDEVKTDTINTTVDDFSPSSISLTPMRKKQIKVTATYFGNPVVSDLDVDDMYYGAQQTDYYLSLPYGSHRLRMTHNGKYKEERVRINKNSSSIYRIPIPTKSAFIWPWYREYNADAMGFSLSYVQKQLLYTDESDKTTAYNTWGESGKWLQGVQAGVYFQPTFSWGLGLHTGLYYEYYTSTNDELTEVDDFNLYTEHALYLPLHLYFRIPFSEQIALAVHGGLGANCGLARSIACKDEESYNAPIELEYGTNEYTGRYNFASELSLAFRLYSVQLQATYSKGFVDSNRDISEQIPSQNKLAVGLSWVFGSNSY